MTILPRILLTALCLAGAARGAEELFPAVTELDAQACMPRDARLTVRGDGTVAVGGTPRFLTGVQMPNRFQDSMARTEGYPVELRWLYEDRPTYESMQRVGVDSVGYFLPDAWQREVVASYQSKHDSDGNADYLAGLVGGIRLPLYVDFTCFPWTNGALAKEKLVPATAINAGGTGGEHNHWVSYSATHPDGIALWKRMWSAGVRWQRKQGGRPLFYELFNEPAYDDPSPSNRELFAQALEARYGTIAALNAAVGRSFADWSAAAAAARDRSASSPGLEILWGRFMEQAFADLVRTGVETITALDPQALCSVQPMGHGRTREVASGNLNLVSISRLLPIIETGTGGGFPSGADGNRGPGDGLDEPPASALAARDPDARTAEGILHRRWLLSLAQGKPIIDGEAYISTTAQGTANTLWLEMGRGASAAYFFVWGRRSWDPLWKPEGSEEGGRRVAAAYPWQLLNPYAVPTEALTGINRFRQQYVRAGAPFAERGNRPAPAIGLLVSLASERWCAANGLLDTRAVLSWTSALEFSHQRWEAVADEQLADGALDRYRVLCAAGVSQMDPADATRLRAWVRAGGLLILAGRLPQQDGLGHPAPWSELDGVVLGDKPGPGGPLVLAAAAALPGLGGDLAATACREVSAPASWEVLASIGDRPAAVRSAVGAGAVVVLGADLPAYQLAALVGPLLAAQGASPLCSLLEAERDQLVVNVELHQAERDGIASWMLFNGNRFPVLARLRPAAGAAEAGVDAIAGHTLPVAQGAVLVLLPPREVVVVETGASAALQRRRGSLPAWDAGALRAAYATLQATAERTRLEAQAAAGSAAFAVDAGRCELIDVRPQANRAFLDKVPGDGAGGWTDQGAANSLEGVPYGRQTWAGVPFDLIRFDENADRTCLAFASPRMRGGLDRADIPLAGVAEALYLLHAASWAKSGSLAATATITYQDGSSVEAPIRCGIQVGDWWLDNAVNREPGMAAHLAWTNSHRRGLWAWRWINPHPERPLAGLRIAAGGGDAIYLLVAATLERPAPGVKLLGPGAGEAKANPFRGATVGREEAGLTLTAGNESYSGVNIRFGGRGLPLPAGSGHLLIEVQAAGEGVFPGLKARLQGVGADGSAVDGGWARIPAPKDGATLVRALLPLDGQGKASVLPMKEGRITGFGLQFTQGVPPGSTVRVLRAAVVP